MKALKIMLSLGIIAAICAGCSNKGRALGDGGKIYVVADSLTWVELETPLRNAFERSIQTPRDETIFPLIWVSQDKFNQYATRKNIILVGTLDSDGEISAKVKYMLSAEVRVQVDEGAAFVFPKENAWANEQLLLVLAAATKEALVQKLAENGDYLHGLLKKRLYADTKNEMFEQKEQTELSAEILEKYGWTFRVQHDYFLNIERADENFVMLRRSINGRERWLFVNWIEQGDPADITEEWALNRRNFLTGKFYQGDIIYESESNPFRSSEITELAGRYTLKIAGLWVNNIEDAKGTGGPFINYTFYDEDTQRIYMIDVAVWFPAGEKAEFLRQLEIIAHTFQTKTDIQRQKSEDS